MQEKFEQLKSKAFSFAFKMKKGPKLQNWKKEKQKKVREQAHRWDNKKRKKKRQTNKKLNKLNGSTRSTNTRKIFILL